MTKEVFLKSVDLPNGETLAYREMGEGSKVLLVIHGNYCSSVHMDIIMDNMPDGYKIYAPDLRGYGDSTYNTPISSLKELAEDVKLLADELGLKQFDIFGWSLGGGVVLQFAADYPDFVRKAAVSGSVGIKGFPLYKTGPDFKPSAERITTMEEIAKDPLIAAPVLNIYKNRDKATLKQIFNASIYTGNNINPETYDKYLEATLKQRNLVEADYALTSFNMTHEHSGVVEGTGDIDKIKGPVLVMQGTKDVVVSKEQYQTIKDGLGDRAVIAEFEGCGHAPMVDETEEFMQVLLNFLGK
ncbi:alpha/beta hydrolase [Anaerocolumna aminovalerica]|uniref:Pimeloyl-ACP methyl ester carboxylesterase n=1 Tax=Anaerocolumna aminovalerica TaxID=1527 RepID=A0A1I5FIK6_9FIRM|nr:alpha/beta hydrolase [Anaerocolumna aminovalerica]MBU5333421.1 alpha/beta hydrolase [Anaerocolumna aminovalerica]SFO23141.1 Pimeloyl-ACP methyl ester carboxylesterase [Anaerocolumna aminovalerica]